jgi:hypothetical protein
MKKGYRHIVCAWMLMLCFVAGQWAVYAHQHRTFAGSVKHAHGTVVTEKCQLCDAMHHSSMIQHAGDVFAPIVVINHDYTQDQYDFVSISLILSAGRAPPAA